MESVREVQQETKPTSWYHIKATKPPLFLSIILLAVRSYWCEILWCWEIHDQKPVFQMHNEALKPLAESPTSSNSLQKLINTRPRDHICDPQNAWISNVKCWKTFENLHYTKYLYKAHLASTVNAVFFICICLIFLLLQILIQCWHHSLV